MTSGPEPTGDRPAYRSFWEGVGRSFPSLKGALSTDYYFEGECLLIEEFLPELRGRSLLKTDLWDEARNTEILRWAAERGATPLGIDISAETVERARGVLAGHRPGLFVADVRALPFRDGSVDHVYSMGTIEHFAEYRQAAAEIFRVLRPGGRAIVGVPNKLDPFLRPLLVHVLNAFGAYPYGVEKSFTQGELRRLLEAVGFRVVGSGGVLFMPGWLRMLDLIGHAHRPGLERVTRALVRPFVWLSRRVPAVRRHGYLIACGVEKPALELAGRAAAAPALPLASGRDLLGIAQMAAGSLLTAVVPQAWIPAAARALATLQLAATPEAVRCGAAEMRRRLGPELGPEEARTLFAEHVKRKLEHLLGRARDTHGSGWHPELELLGAEHLERALDRGHGAVLWTMAFCGPVVPKMALHRAGFRVAHLSMPFHGGFSRSRAAVRVLNPWTLRSESRHLGERVVIPLDGSLGYMRRLRAILAANGCLSIAGEHRGRQNVRVPLLGEEEGFATGAWSLARSSGAALLPVHAQRRGPGSYRVVIEPPLAVDPQLPKAESARAVVGAFAALLERSVRASPADWERWSTIDPAELP
jgi:lauroyl/myristoyl acyltransferase/SAM-dependent methyltransferase